MKGIMEELDALLKKYQSLSKNHSASFDRLKWGQEDFVGLRERLRSNITLLTAFNTSLAKYVPSYSLLDPLLPGPNSKQGKEGKEIDRTPFDTMMEVLYCRQRK